MKAAKAMKREGSPFDYSGQTPARSGWLTSLLAVTLAGSLLVGCGGKSDDKPKTIMPTTTRPSATDIDPQLATSTYWLNQPATSETSFKEFQKLWDSCEAVAYGYLLKIDRRDYRHGLLTTQPMISKQWFEPWRKDAPTNRDVEEASLGGIRRTIYFQFTQNLDGSYTVAPKVVVERESRVDPKYLADASSNNYNNPNTSNTGTIDSAGQITVYWYALRRDAQMEIKLVAAIREKLDEGK
ncbi:MAG: hypothetical protein ABSH20_10675 [Tepidisphaeraceae bacterium]|jgi:hypothetical protein